MNQLSNQKLIDIIEWDRQVINSGSTTSTQIVVGKIGKGKPRALIVAGIHGDEQPWASFAINKMLNQTRESELLGTLIIIPIANPNATESNARVSQLDYLDLNRVFPGDQGGTYTERIASLIAEIVHSGVDLVIDLHGGGSWCVNAFSFKFVGSEKYSEAFDAPFIVEGMERQNTLTGYARSMGANITAIEMGGKCSEENSWADKISNGIRKALGLANVLSITEENNECKSVPVGKTTVLRPSKGGILIPELDSKNVGTIVKKGTLLGRIVDPATFETIEVLEAPYPQTAVLLLRPMLTTIEQGAMTYVVAPLLKPNI